MIPIKREYQSWVANETLEDYALRYAARSYRRWSPFVLANTAIGGISFLALEAIGGSITIGYGFQNAVAAIVMVSVLIWLVTLPITYYSSVANVDIDLLTRGAGFGYIGSTLTSLIYASFTFIFFAIEAAIMAQALELGVGLNITLGYVLCSLVIIPLVFFGVTLINKLQMWTQPVWVLLLVLPFAYILYRDPSVLAAWSSFSGTSGTQTDIDPLMFGAATGVLLSLVVQVGEQTDYLRFLPDRTRKNRAAWWWAMLGGGPGWIVIGGLKLLAGSLLAVLALRAGASSLEAVAPINMYIKAYEYVFDDRVTIVAVAVIFVVISQVKINVTNAYGGSLAWSNAFARLAHYHPGRVVWLVFNILIALVLTLLGIFATLEAVLSVYSNVATAWIGALVADLVVLKPLGVSPRYIEFKRAHLYNFNPVGCGALLIASTVSIVAYSGAFGELARAYSVFIALIVAFVSAIAIAFLTKGKYYIARPDLHFRNRAHDEVVRCCICGKDYEPRDMAYCPFYKGPICSLCCGLENHCHDQCKKATLPDAPAAEVGLTSSVRFAPHFGRRLGRFFGLFGIVAAAMGAVFLLSYRLLDVNDVVTADGLASIFTRIYAATLIVIAIGTWWIVLSHESRELAEGELRESLHHLEVTRSELVESEKMALLGRLVAGVAHEINTPVGIAVSAASYLQERTEDTKARLTKGGLEAAELKQYLEDASQSARLLLSNANRAANLVDSFKKVAVDQTSDQKRRFDLRNYVEETLASLRPKLEGTRIGVTVEIARGIELDSFPGPLSQVLTNLILNSLQHAFDPGASGRIVISAWPSGDNEVVIRYEDDGRGIPQVLHDKVFEPFFTTKRGAGGSGLGLHLVYNIVTRKLGGSIAIENGTGGGTVFTIRIPRVGRSSASIASLLNIGPGGKL